MMQSLKDFICGKPEVILDFIFDQGLFYISIINIGRNPAYKISVKFDQIITGVEGRKNINEMALFKNIEFLPPQKEIKSFLDSSTAYFSRNEPTSITVTINYENERHIKFTKTIAHNLEIYREFGYVVHSD